MRLKLSPTHPVFSPVTTADERAQDLCRLARRYEEAGDYGRAEAALREFWAGVGTEPSLNDLGPAAAAEVLLRAGAITRRVGGSDAAGDVQEWAKDLIGRSLRIYEGLNLPERVAEAKGEMAYCYWRRGEYDNARVLLREAVAGLVDADLKAEAILRGAVVEKCAGHAAEALAALNEAAPLFESSGSRALRGRFHLERATFLKALAESGTDREELIDRALIEYAAASHHFHEAGHERNVALVENQVGFILIEKGEFAEAHDHLARARETFVALGDHFRAAQVDETRARAFIGERRFEEAARAASHAVGVLGKGDARALLSEALTTLGRAQARGGDYEAARTKLYRAVEVAKVTGEASLIVSAVVAAVEELVGHAPAGELAELYVEASAILPRAGDAGVRRRLHACADSLVKATAKATAKSEPARRVAAVIASSLPGGDRIDWKEFSLADTVRAVEEAFIRRALNASQGSVSKAALLLGYRHPESLNSKIKKLGLHSERTPPRGRRRGVISRSRRRDGGGGQK
jgi:tetratricopeptide (TPR) repeat protein